MIKSRFFYALPLLALLSLACISNQSSLYALYHGFTLKYEWNEDPLERPYTPESIHKYFLNRGLFIPKDSILKDEEVGGFLGVREQCETGKIYVWVPLRLRMPLAGEKVWEWCLSLS